MTPHLLLHLVDAAELLFGRVTSRWVGGALELRIDRTDVLPAALPALLEAGRRTLIELVPLIQTAHALPATLPVVRYFMERDMAGSQLMHMDSSPYQVDVHLRYDLMPQDLADEVAGHYTHAIRHLP